VGALRYLVNTRPDLAYLVGYVSRFIEKPTTEHLLAIKRVLRYIAGTMNIGCCYERRGGAVVLVGFSDNDLAGDFGHSQKYHWRPILLGWQSDYMAIPKSKSGGLVQLRGKIHCGHHDSVCYTPIVK
jgi:hypothetical protein